ncbi:hypothetical protein [Nonomuraea salmonea]|uniref:hypothetical protein n=1 Tax=Nonomuraea salmonea TaxID=46181 RepID=UPI002FE88369
MLTLLRAAVPLCLAMIAGMVGSLVVTSVLGQHDTVTLAAFAVVTAVLNPASAAVQGALRGLGPFVAPFRDDPAAAVPVIRDARWLSLAAGALGGGRGGLRAAARHRHRRAGRGGGRDGAAALVPRRIRAHLRLHRRRQHHPGRARTQP